MVSKIHHHNFSLSWWLPWRCIWVCVCVCDDDVDTMFKCNQIFGTSTWNLSLSLSRSFATVYFWCALVYYTVTDIYPCTWKLWLCVVSIAHCSLFIVCGVCAAIVRQGNFHVSSVFVMICIVVFFETYYTHSVFACVCVCFEKTFFASYPMVYVVFLIKENEKLEYKYFCLTTASSQLCSLYMNYYT